MRPRAVRATGPVTALSIIAAAPAIAVGVILATVLRVPFLRAPISGDEGGYAAIARWWAEGTPLYSDGALVDRPQLLVLLYRIADAIAPGDPIGVRSLAAVFGAASVVLSVVLAARLTGNPRTVWATALVAAGVGASPALESFSAYGELLAGVPTLAALVLFVRWWRGGPSLQLWMPALAGALGAFAVLIKQSGFDGLTTMGTLLVVSALKGRERRRSLLALAAVVLGACVPVGVALAHGIATVGWTRYYDALAGYRLRYLSVVDGSTGERLSTLAGQSQRIAPLLMAVGVLALIGTWLGPRRPVLFAWVWLAWTVLGFLAGGLFWLHYFLGPILPLSLLAGMGASALLCPDRRGMRLASGFVCIGLCCSLISLQNISALTIGARRDGSESALEIDGRHQLAASYVAARTAPDDTVQGLWQSGAVAWHADRRPVSRYLWATWFAYVPGALEELSEQLRGAQRPAYVVEIHDLDIIPGAEVVADALADGYVLETTLRDVEIWRRSDRPQPVPA